MGRNEPLKLLLNQRSPAEFSRNVAYYGYLGRQRAGHIEQIAEHIAKIEQLDAQIAAEDAELARLEATRKGELGELEQARRQRGQVLASLEREAGGRTATLQRLRQDRAALERTLERIRRATRSLPYDPNLPFAQTRGRLNWPAAGRIIVNYGATISSELRSVGIDIDTDRDEPVKAVHEGRVVFTDWLSGRGQVIVIDHGNDYLSIYAHLGELYVANGKKVTGGETIATAGDSGGRKTTGLYFEIRRDEKPVDPRGWFRTAAPPSG
jgi:septal ring factor EnvC (AmiA/AmiB activator)